MSAAAHPATLRLRLTLERIVYPIRLAGWGLVSLVRRLRTPPAFVTFVIDGDYPELPDPAPPLWQRPIHRPRLSMLELSSRFRAVAKDPRVSGVILHLRPVPMSLTRIQALRAELELLRAAGKRTLCWATQYSPGTFYLACGADSVLIQPAGSIAPLGTSRAYMFLGDVLKRLGLKADLVRVGPYKTAGDPLIDSRMSEEMREMVSWLADDDHRELVQAIAAGRHMTAEAAQAVVDGSPCTDQEALEMGAVDAIISEEEIAGYLAKDSTVRLAPWHQARRALTNPAPSSPGRFIALLRVEGPLVDGESRRAPGYLPPGLFFPWQTRTGDLTLVRQARRLGEDRRVAAVVLHVDSPGGSSTASEAMASALAALAARKPVVCSLGAVAASGGYYVATPAREVLAWPATLTGSIGVFALKISGGPLLERLGIRRETVERGRHAAMFDPGRPFTEEEREREGRAVARVYQVFLDRVARGRRMDRAAADAIGGGRVWTGNQALERGLVDRMGGIQDAIAVARHLAALNERAAVRELPAPKAPLSPPAGGPLGNVLSALDMIAPLGRARALCLSTLLARGHL